MRRGSLFTLMGDCESTSTRQLRRPRQSIPSSTPSASSSPDATPSSMAVNHSVQSGFYDQGEPISLSVSYNVSHHPQPEMAQSYEYDALAASYSYAPNESPQAFYVEPFEAETTGESVSPAPQETLGQGNGEVPPASTADNGSPTQTTPASPRPSESPSSEDLEPTPTEVMPSEDDEFEADLREILVGKKRYDSDHRRAVAVDGTASEPETQPSQSAPEATPDSPATKNDHAIFDRIAQSMQLANAYDLGSIALDQRFDAFDQEDDHREKKSH